MLTEINQTQRGNTSWSHFYEHFLKVKFREPEHRLVVARDWEREKYYSQDNE